MDSGLADVIAAETVLSHSDGARRRIWIRGHALEQRKAGRMIRPQSRYVGPMP